MTIWHLKQIGNVKKLDKWVFQELTANQKNHHFEVWSSLILCNNKEAFFFFFNWIEVQHKVDCIQQLGMTSSVVGWKRSSKALSKVKLAQIRSWSVWWSAASLIHCRFLNLRIIISEKYVQQIDEMH